MQNAILSEDFQKLEEKLRTALKLVERMRQASQQSMPLADRYASERGYHPEAHKVLKVVCDISGREFREVDVNLSIISSRLKEKGIVVAEVVKMLQRMGKLWRGTDMQQYLRPATLFRASKFENYYADRDLPLNGAVKRERGTNI